MDKCHGNVDGETGGGGADGEVIVKSEEGRTLVFFRLFKVLSISECVEFIFYSAVEFLS